MFQLAMVSANPKVITLEAASGATFLDRSVNGGKTWTQATFDGGQDLDHGHDALTEGGALGSTSPPRS